MLLVYVWAFLKILSVGLKTVLGSVCGALSVQLLGLDIFCYAVFYPLRFSLFSVLSYTSYFGYLSTFMDAKSSVGGIF